MSNCVRRGADKPQANRAKSRPAGECVELAPAFEEPNTMRQRQQAGRTPYAWPGGGRCKTSATGKQVRLSWWVSFGSELTTEADARTAASARPASVTRSFASASPATAQPPRPAAPLDSSQGDESPSFVRDWIAAAVAAAPRRARPH